MIRACPSCATKNRVPAAHLADEGRCGRCQAALPPLAEPVPVDAAAFDAIVQDARVPVLIDFWAEWCAPCRQAAPEAARTAEEMAGRAIVLKVDTEAQPELASRFKVSGIPSFVVMKDGQVVFQQPGFVRHPVMQDWLRRAGA